MVRRDAGAVVPMPRKEAIEEIAVVEVEVKLVKVKLPPFVRLYPAASTFDVHGVRAPPESVPHTT